MYVCITINKVMIMNSSAWLHLFLHSDIDEDVRSLKQFSTTLVVEATAQCLHSIDSSLDIQYRLPPSMAAQFRIGTSLATAIQVRLADGHYYHHAVKGCRPVCPSVILLKVTT